MNRVYNLCGIPKLAYRYKPKGRRPVRRPYGSEMKRRNRSSDLILVREDEGDCDDNYLLYIQKEFKEAE